jgi:hypothetical protein
MKPIAMLVVLLGTLLAGMGIILNAPPFVEPAVRFIIGAGLLGTMAVVLGGPIGKALASQLKGEQPGAPADGRVLAQLDDLSQDLQALRDDLGQLHERMDFTERLLTQQSQEPRLRAGEPRGQ